MCKSAWLPRLKLDRNVERLRPETTKELKGLGMQCVAFSFGNWFAIWHGLQCCSTVYLHVKLVGFQELA